MEETCIKIIDGVFLGSYKTSMSISTLSANKISHILSVGQEMEINFKNNYKFMKLELSDTEDEDGNILFNFDSIFNFIEEGREESGVLIQSHEGISLSQTITIAYLIKKLKCTFEDSFKMVKDLKPDINLNEGFIEKLKVFEKVANKPIENSYKCSICRKVLFDDSNIDFTHEFTPKKNYSYKRYKKSFVNTTDCTSYFLSSLSLINLEDEYGGKIMCFNKNCKNKIGEFNPKGSQCSCGSWVVPAIQIMKCKVDKVPLLNKYNNSTTNNDNV